MTASTSPPVRPPIGAFKPYCRDADLTAEEQQIVDRFHDLYYSKLDGGVGLHTIVLAWMGHEMFKCPMDLWLYQELIVLRRPNLIIETGTYKGGSALYLACICDMVGEGSVVTVDIDDTHRAIQPQHPRLRYVSGSSTAPEIFAQVAAQAAAAGPEVMVILDSDHRRDHVLDELRLYSELVPVGGLLVVEDTNVNGHPTYPEFGPGPWEAVDAFLAENPRFVADRSFERFLLTMNPRGVLRRVE
ncbi:CmcI family methyltransferase [Caulobacter sp. CCG-8]|uniref:CmcI family methyltransferase n=1 Tax=Caulobacter sp. CCG-8 TaxID=3127958 RepID=UPI00307CF7CD